MSAIGGIVDFERPDAYLSAHCRAVLSRLDGALARLGPDSGRTCAVGHVGMVYRLFLVDAPEVHAAQPLEFSSLLLCVDGRLDDVADLRQRLGGASSSLTEPELIASAYQRWGERCFDNVRGDFAIAVWDERRSRLVLARDPAGVRPLYFAHRGERVYWASTPDAVAASALEDLSVDRVYVSGYLLSRPDPGRSPFREVMAVRPGHLVVIDRDRRRSVPFWSIWDCVKHRREASYPDYESEFRYYFTNAVRNRLRAATTVVAELSGGLDSSSIVCVADTLAGKSRDTSPMLATVSYVYDRARHSDERQYIRIVEDQRNCPGIHLREDDAPFLSCWVDSGFLSFPNPLFAAGGRVTQVLGAMQRIGARVILSGSAGDHVLMGEEFLPFELADLLQQRRLGALVRGIRSWARATGLPVWDLAGRAAIRPWRGKWQRDDGRINPVIPVWFHPRLREEALASNPFAGTGENRRWLLPSKSRFCTVVELAIATIAAGHGGLHSTLGCCETRYPYLDRPLMEFLTGVPTEQLHRPQQRRSIQRRALSTVLPKEIAQRSTKGSPDHAAMLGVRDQYSFLRSLLMTSLAGEYEYIDRGQALHALDRLRAGVNAGLPSFLRLIALEVWLRALYKPNSLVWPGTEALKARAERR